MNSRYALAFIFMTMLIDTIGLGVIIPVSPRLIAGLTHEAISGAARWGGWLFFSYALMQFLCAPLIGNLSDRFGRRPVLILSLAMLGVDYLITGLAPTIAWLFIGRTLSGMAGAAYPTANAYIADISPPEKRAANFGLVGAAFGVGFVLGPALGGFVGEHFGLRAPFYVAAGLSFANALFGLFALKESLPPERRRHFEIWARQSAGLAQGPVALSAADLASDGAGAGTVRARFPALVLELLHHAEIRLGPGRSRLVAGRGRRADGLFFCRAAQAGGAAPG